MPRFTQKLLLAATLSLALTAWLRANEFLGRHGDCGCECYYCQRTTETKKIKKTVYAVKEVPFCLHAMPKFGQHHCCPDCECQPRFKKVLIKKEVVVCEECVSKCVPVKAPCTTCSQTHFPLLPPAGAAPPLPQPPKEGPNQAATELPLPPLARQYELGPATGARVQLGDQ